MRSGAGSLRFSRAFSSWLAPLVSQDKDAFSRKPGLGHGVRHDGMDTVTERDFQHLQGGVYRASDSRVLRAWSSSARTRSPSAHSR